MCQEFQDHAQFEQFASRTLRTYNSPQGKSVQSKVGTETR